jgi:hypothetical protein
MRIPTSNGQHPLRFERFSETPRCELSDPDDPIFKMLPLNITLDSRRRGNNFKLTMGKADTTCLLGGSFVLSNLTNTVIRQCYDATLYSPQVSPQFKTMSHTINRDKRCHPYLDIDLTTLLGSTPTPYMWLTGTTTDPHRDTSLWKAICNSVLRYFLLKTKTVCNALEIPSLAATISTQSGVSFATPSRVTNSPARETCVSTPHLPSRTKHSAVVVSGRGGESDRGAPEVSPWPDVFIKRGLQPDIGFDVHHTSVKSSFHIVFHNLWVENANAHTELRNFVISDLRRHVFLPRGATWETFIDTSVTGKRMLFNDKGCRVHNNNCQIHARNTDRQDRCLIGNATEDMVSSTRRCSCVLSRGGRPSTPFAVSDDKGDLCAPGTVVDFNTFVSNSQPQPFDLVHGTNFNGQETNVQHQSNSAPATPSPSVYTPSLFNQAHTATSKKNYTSILSSLSGEKINTKRQATTVEHEKIKLHRRNFVASSPTMKTQTFARQITKLFRTSNAHGDQPRLERWRAAGGGGHVGNLSLDPTQSWPLVLPLVETLSFPKPGMMLDANVTGDAPSTLGLSTHPDALSSNNPHFSRTNWAVAQRLETHSPMLKSIADCVQAAVYSAEKHTTAFHPGNTQKQIPAVEDAQWLPTQQGKEKGILISGNMFKHSTPCPFLSNRKKERMAHNGNRISFWLKIGPPGQKSVLRISCHDDECSGEAVKTHLQPEESQKIWREWTNGQSSS